MDRMRLFYNTGLLTMVLDILKYVVWYINNYNGKDIGEMSEDLKRFSSSILSVWGVSMLPSMGASMVPCMVPSMGP